MVAAVGGGCPEAATSCCFTAALCRARFRDLDVMCVRGGVLCKVVCMRVSGRDTHWECCAGRHHAQRWCVTSEQWACLIVACLIIACLICDCGMHKLNAPNCTG